jgi:hypothetical protein
MNTPEIWWVIGVIILAVALIWGMRRHSRRTSGEAARTEAATRALYDNAGRAQPMAGDAPTREAERREGRG